MLGVGREINTATCIGKGDSSLRSPENQPSPVVVGARHGVPLHRATRMILISWGGPRAHECSVAGRVIPAKAGIQYLSEMDPRFRGGDLLTFISTGGPLAHDHSEYQLLFAIQFTASCCRVTPPHQLVIFVRFGSLQADWLWATVQTLAVDSRFRGNDDAGEGVLNHGLLELGSDASRASLRTMRTTDSPGRTKVPCLR